MDQMIWFYGNKRVDFVFYEVIFVVFYYLFKRNKKCNFLNDFQGKLLNYGKHQREYESGFIFD